MGLHFPLTQGSVSLLILLHVLLRELCLLLVSNIESTQSTESFLIVATEWLNES